MHFYLLAAAFSVPLMFGDLASETDTRKIPETYQGEWVEGDGDREILRLIDAAFRSMYMSPDMATLPLLYKRDWDGFVEGPYWPGWWIQNSFGPSYGMMPFFGEPYRTWIRHSQGLWFNMMGNGERTGANGYVAPDGSLMDCAFLYMQGSVQEGFGDLRDRPGTTNGVFDGSIAYEKAVYRQGDGNTQEYDWYYGGAAAGIIMEAERLLVTRDPGEISARLPQLQRVAAFLDARRDLKTNLLRGGRSSNLLAPSYGGVKQSDGSYASAYLTELSVNYIAALEKLAVLCEMTGQVAEAAQYRAILSDVRDALPLLMEPGGYFIRYMEEDGTRHGVFGADTFGYMEATPNHDAVALGVVNERQSDAIIAKMLSIPQLYPHHFILPNYPRYDDLDNPTVLKHLPHGMWVDGGFWSTTQGRMNIACLRVEAFEHPFAAWKKQLQFMTAFRAGAPMKDFGERLWDDKIRKYGYNVVYDCWGVPGGLLRGLFEYRYLEDRLELNPHLPPSVTRYVQKHPVWYGDTEVYISVHGSGSPRSATANGAPCSIKDGKWIVLKPDGKPGQLVVDIVCGEEEKVVSWKPSARQEPLVSSLEVLQEVEGFGSSVHPHLTLERIRDFYAALERRGLESGYEGAVAKLIIEHIEARHARQKKLAKGSLHIPEITGTPKALEQDIDAAFVRQAAFMAGGLLDHLTGRSYWKDPVDPVVFAAAREAGLVLDQR